MVRRGMSNDDVARTVRQDSRYKDADALMIASWIQFNPTWRSAFEDAERVREERRCLEEARREVESWFKEPVTYPTAEAGGHSGDP
jgi:hypothetical protein